VEAPTFARFWDPCACSQAIRFEYCFGCRRSWKNREELEEALHSAGGIFDRLHREMEENNLSTIQPGPWNARLEPFPSR
jgi:hypothetical protein